MLLLAGAVVAWSLWLGEVCIVKGWEGVAWLSGFNWASLPICVVIVVVTAIFVPSRGLQTSKLKFVGTGVVITVIAFFLARRSAFELFSGATTASIGVMAFATLALTATAVSVGLTIAGNRWLSKLHRWTAGLLILGLVLTLPMSYVTIRLLPALNGSTDMVHAVKMGYPVFWTVILVPLAIRAGARSDT